MSHSSLNEFYTDSISEKKKIKEMKNLCMHVSNTCHWYTTHHTKFWGNGHIKNHVRLSNKPF